MAKPKTPENICTLIQIGYSDDGYISLSHLNKNRDVISECLCDPEEAYEYAHGILKVYDKVMNLEPDETDE
jgi:hypothetical protein